MTKSPLEGPSFRNDTLAIDVPTYELLEDTVQSLELPYLCFLPLREWDLHPSHCSASEGRTCLPLEKETTKNTKGRSSVLDQKGYLTPAFGGRELEV